MLSCWSNWVSIESRSILSPVNWAKSTKMLCLLDSSSMFPSRVPKRLLLWRPRPIPISDAMIGIRMANPFTLIWVRWLSLDQAGKVGRMSSNSFLRSLSCLSNSPQTNAPSLARYSKSMLFLFALHIELTLPFSSLVNWLKSILYPFFHFFLFALSCYRICLLKSVL